MSELSNVVKNDAVRKTEYDEIVKKINVIQPTDTRNLFKKKIMTQKLMKLKIIMNK